MAGKNKSRPTIVKSQSQKRVNRLVTFKKHTRLIRKGGGSDLVKPKEKRTVTYIKYDTFSNGKMQYVYYFANDKYLSIPIGGSVSEYFSYDGGYVDNPHKVINARLKETADKANKGKAKSKSSSSSSNDKEVDSSSSSSSDGGSSESSGGDSTNPELAAKYKEYGLASFNSAMLQFGDYQRTVDGNGNEIIKLDKDGKPMLNTEKYSIYAEKSSNVRESRFGGNITRMMKEVKGIHGMPYKFLPSADMPPSKKTDAGRIYKREIVDNVPLLLLTPGVPKFMDDFDDDTKHDVLSALTRKDDEGGSAMLDQIVGDKTGMFYNFSFRFAEYYDYVNTILNAMANLLGIGEFKYEGTPLNRYHWQNFANEISAGLITRHQSVPFYIDAQTQANETFANATGECQLAEQVNNVSTYAKELQFVIGGAGGAHFEELVQTGLDKALTGITNVLSSFEKILPAKVVHKILGGFGTLATGGKLLFPEIWQDATFSKSQDISMKFVSPSGDPVSIFLNVIVPTVHLICLAAPRQMNGNGYQAPYVVRAWYKGMFSTDLGIIESLSIKRGDKGKWNKDGLPTTIEVEFSIKDLYSAMSITKRDSPLGTDLIQNPLLLSYMATMCGINSYKPDIMRTFELYKTSIQNIPSDFINRIFDKATQGLTNMFDIQNPDTLSTLSFAGYMSIKNGFTPNKKHKDKDGKDVYDYLNPNLPEGFDGVKIDKNLSPDEQVRMIARSLQNYNIDKSKKDTYAKIEKDVKAINKSIADEKLNLPPLKIDTPDEFAKKHSNPTNSAYSEYVKKTMGDFDKKYKEIKEKAEEEKKNGQPSSDRPAITPTGKPGRYDKDGVWIDD